MLTEVNTGALIALCLGILAEFGLLLLPKGLIKKCLICFGVILLSLSSLLFWQILSYELATLVVLANFYRMLNLVRQFSSRSTQQYITKKAFATTAYLGGLQFLILLGYVIWQLEGMTSIKPSINGLLLLTYLQLITAFAVAYYSLKNLFFSKTAQDLNLPKNNSHSLPTVSFLVPARNETQYLKPCLESILASDYPKLEIIVLDDCSQDNTSEIIREFAHSGVRFIDGQSPPEKWLAKNFAYQQLADEASGKILIFMGVDARISQSTISMLVSHMLENKLSMVSVLPMKSQDSWLSTTVQPLRYWLEIALPKIIKRRPPLISTFWAIDRKSYKKLGGFKSVSRSILPENYFAREFNKSKSYQFMLSRNALGVTTYKEITDQYDTAARVRYPQLKKALQNLFFFSVFEVVLLLLPFWLLAHAVLVVGLTWSALAPALTVALLTLSHGLINFASKTPRWYIAGLFFPLAVIIDLIASHYSMYKYEFSEVFWKNRNICLPVMHIIPKLPKA